METRGRELVKVSPPSPLSEDVIVEILSRLPVKLVLRSRCVSKDWYALTNSPHFISVHRNQLHCLHPNLSLILEVDVSCVTGYKYGFALLCDEETVSGLDLPNFMLDRKIANVRVVGSSNGLVCLSLLEFGADQRDIIVWNVATKQFQYLPEPVFSESCDMDNSDPMLGFEFIDDIASGYRLVRIFRNFEHADRRAQVFTQGTNAWREIIGGSCEESSSSYCIWTWITVNGVMYWLVCDNSSVSNYVFSFNLRDEVFGLIPLPSGVRADFSLFSWKNSLAIFSSNRSEFWVMTEESAEMPWTKLFTLSSLGPGPGKNFFGVWKDQFLYSEIEIDATGNVNWQCLFLYDLTSKTGRKLSKVEAKGYLLAIDYVESLAPV